MLRVSSNSLKMLGTLLFVFTWWDMNMNLLWRMRNGSTTTASAQM